MDHKFSATYYDSEKGRWIREGGCARSSNRDGDPLALPGARTKALLRSRRSLRRAWLNLIIIVSLTYTHAHTSTYARICVCARALKSAYEPRLGSANRDSQHTIRGELNIPISSGTFERLFSTLRLARSVSSFRTRAFWRYWDCATIIRNYGNKDDYGRINFDFSSVHCDTEFSTGQLRTAVFYKILFAITRGTNLLAFRYE